jgi:hypothetical protein
VDDRRSGFLGCFSSDRHTGVALGRRADKAMTVARTAARRRKQMRMDVRYGRRATVSKKLQGRSKLLALNALTQANRNAT